MSWHK